MPIARGCHPTRWVLQQSERGLLVPGLCTQVEEGGRPVQGGEAVCKGRVLPGRTSSLSSVVAVGDAASMVRSNTEEKRPVFVRDFPRR